MVAVVRRLLNNPAKLRQFREQLVPSEIAWVHQDVKIVDEVD